MTSTKSEKLLEYKNQKSIDKDNIKTRQDCLDYLEKYNIPLELFLKQEKMLLERGVKKEDDEELFYKLCFKHLYFEE